MPIWRVDIPPGETQDWLDAWGQGYESILDNGTANPETKIQFARKRALEILTSRVRNHKNKKAHEGVTDSGATIS